MNKILFARCIGNISGTPSTFTSCIAMILGVLLALAPLGVIATEKGTYFARLSFDPDIPTSGQPMTVRVHHSALYQFYGLELDVQGQTLVFTVLLNNSINPRVDETYRDRILEAPPSGTYAYIVNVVYSLGGDLGPGMPGSLSVRGMGTVDSPAIVPAGSIIAEGLLVLLLLGAASSAFRGDFVAGVPARIGLAVPVQDDNFRNGPSKQSAVYQALESISGRKFIP
jgi:hypothetical protein